MTDKEIIQRLINHDERVTRWFFQEKCRPLFLAIIRNVFDYPVEYDEFVDELYLLLMENDAHRLRLFDFRSSICQWIKTVALRHFIKKHKSMIEDLSKESLYQQEPVESEDPVARQSAQIDMQRMLESMKIPRQAHVIRRLVLEDADPKEVAQELGVTVDNLYNIKKRAIAALTQVALADKHQYKHGRTIR